MYQMFPLLAISLVVYAVLTFTGAVGSAETPWFEVTFVQLPMVSGDQWRVAGETAREAERFEWDERVREVEQGPEGALWVLEDGGRLLKLTPG